MTVLRKLPDECIDFIATDPPYGLGYKVARTHRTRRNNWDDKVPPVRVWKECLRVLKPGAFAFVMSSPRQDLLVQMITNLSKAGFRVDFPSIYSTYKTGFPKGTNVSKAIDRKLGFQPKVVSSKIQNGAKFRGIEQAIHNGGYNDPNRRSFELTEPVSEEARAFEQARGGFQPKPMLEVIIVAMKPLSKNRYYLQALENGKGVTWPGNCLIPSEDVSRFPGNLLSSSDDAPSDELEGNQGPCGLPDGGNELCTQNVGSGSKGLKRKIEAEGIFPRCSDLNAWFEAKLKELPENVQRAFPFLIVPKPNAKEKNRGLENWPEVVRSALPLRDGSGNYVKNEYGDGSLSTRNTLTKNYHPTVKAIRLFSFLVTLGTRSKDVVLDCFFGSGTTGLACQMLGRHFIGIDIDRDYCDIADARLSIIPKHLLRSRRWRFRSTKRVCDDVSSSLPGSDNTCQVRKDATLLKSARANRSTGEWAI